MRQAIEKCGELNISNEHLKMVRQLLTSLLEAEKEQIEAAYTRGIIEGLAREKNKGQGRIPILAEQYYSQFKTEQHD